MGENGSQRIYTETSDAGGLSGIINEFRIYWNGKKGLINNEEIKRLEAERDFIVNWLTDLVDTMDKVLDRETQVKLFEGCGKGCFNRFKFKQDIAAAVKGDVQKLIDAYKKNFEIWQEGNLVHIRYGEKLPRCYCPAAKYREVKPNDLHCECTSATHQTVFETALERNIKVEIVESLRRGNQTCHFIAHLV